MVISGGGDMAEYEIMAMVLSGGKGKGYQVGECVQHYKLVDGLVQKYKTHLCTPVFQGFPPKLIDHG